MSIDWRTWPPGSPPELSPRLRAAIGDACRTMSRDGADPPPSWLALLEALRPESVTVTRRQERVRALGRARSARWRARRNRRAQEAELAGDAA